MQRKKVFISSVQSEFTVERQALFDYLTSDALLGKFFEPFIFEHTPAKGQSAQKVYLDQVKICDIYIGLFGERYGIEVPGVLNIHNAYMDFLLYLQNAYTYHFSLLSLKNLFY
jgi:hypothetical protein